MIFSYNFFANMVLFFNIFYYIQWHTYIYIFINNASDESFFDAIDMCMYLYMILLLLLLLFLHSNTEYFRSKMFCDLI